MSGRSLVEALSKRDESHKTPLSVQPEGALMLAVLEVALDDFYCHATTHRPRERLYFQSAYAWFDSREASWLYSFENICEVFGIDPMSIRAALNHWLVEKRRKVEHAARRGVEAVHDGTSSQKAETTVTDRTREEGAARSTGEDLRVVERSS